MSSTTLPQAPASAWLPRSVVTGASSGLGHALSLQLAESGVPVVALGRDAIRLERLADQHPTLITPVVCDLADSAAVPELARDLLMRHADIGCLFNNAGVQFNHRIDDARCDPAVIEDELRINLLAPMLLCHAMLPHLCAQPRACIVNIGSALAFAPKRTAAVYSAGKAGLRAFGQALGAQLANSGVRIIHVVPPLMDTPMAAGRAQAKSAPAQVARELLAHLRSQGHADSGDLFIGRARAVRWLHRLTPTLLARLMQRDPTSRT